MGRSVTELLCAGEIGSEIVVDVGHGAETERLHEAKKYHPRHLHRVVRQHRVSDEGDSRRIESGVDDHVAERLIGGVLRVTCIRAKVPVKPERLVKDHRATAKRGECSLALVALSFAYRCNEDLYNFDDIGRNTRCSRDARETTR